MDGQPLQDPRRRTHLCLTCRAALRGARCPRCDHPAVGVHARAEQRRLRDALFTTERSARRGAGCAVSALAGLVFVAMIAGAIAYVKAFEEAPPYWPFDLLCILTFGCLLFLGTLGLGAWWAGERDRRVPRGVASPERPAAPGGRLARVRTSAGPGGDAPVVARQLELFLEDGARVLVDGYTAGLSLETDEGALIEVPAGPIDLRGGETRGASWLAVRRWLAAAGLPRRLFPHARADLRELR
ncbi:MAG: hypothetical protein CMH59_05835, partial [Myxococcales bacterium]|nr:hypothetical protein [Myxococcales bacterium]HJK91053.1 hypothetical protein [Polyangiaceae bacterium LLY-WYZ-15_(1-7)]